MEILSVWQNMTGIPHSLFNDTLSDITFPTPCMPNVPQLTFNPAAFRLVTKCDQFGIKLEDINSQQQVLFK